ncbi:Iron-sulfur clusters transporter atm1, mitochondrial, partial [Kickxella alabastrina]
MLALGLCARTPAASLLGRRMQSASPAAAVGRTILGQCHQPRRLDKQRTKAAAIRQLLSVQQTLGRRLYSSTRDDKAKPTLLTHPAGAPPKPASTAQKQALATPPAAKPAKAKGAMSKAGMIIILSMFKYVWPKGDWATKSRIIAALSLMVASKLLTVQVPILFKDIVDTLNVDLAATGGTLSTVATAMLIGYGAARLGSTLFQELRNAIFANVQQSAIRNLALSVFRHLLNLDIRFHLSRETGGLTRAIDRGTKGISFILSSLVMHLVPTFLEI